MSKDDNVKHGDMGMMTMKVSEKMLATFAI